MTRNDRRNDRFKGIEIGCATCGRRDGKCFLNCVEFQAELDSVYGVDNFDCWRPSGAIFIWDERNVSEAEKQAISMEYIENFLLRFDAKEAGCIVVYEEEDVDGDQH